MTEENSANNKEKEVENRTSGSEASVEKVSGVESEKISRSSPGNVSPGAERPKHAAQSSADKPAPNLPPLLSDAVSTPAPKTGRAIAWFAVLVALGAAAFGGYSWWQVQQYQQEYEAKILQLTELMQNRAPATPDISAELAPFREQARQQQAAVEDMLQRVAALRRQLGEISHVSRQSWMLAEAEYLLRLANQRLLFERDTENVVALLRSADEILAKVDDVYLYQVRGAIARELILLRAAGGADTEGVYLELAALKDQVASLRAGRPQPFAQKTAAPASGDSGETSDKGVFKSALEKLSGYIRVTYPDAPVAPQLAAPELEQVKQNLELMIEQAQLALLSRKAGLYHHSLERASEWLHTHFQLNAQAQVLSDRIEALAQLEIAPEMPDISESLRLLKNYLNNPDAIAPRSANSSDSASEAEGQQADQL